MPDATPDHSAPEAITGATPPLTVRAAQALNGGRSIVLIGLMGAGKTTVGKALATQLNLPFRDADVEIERAAGLSINEIFAQHGEQEFRRGERKVIHRLLTECGPHVLATGGGAFLDSDTRVLIQNRALSVWLKADVDALLRRVSRKNTRPLLRTGDPREVLLRLHKERSPLYALADVQAESSDGAVSDTIQRVLAAIKAALAPIQPEGQSS